MEEQNLLTVWDWLCLAVYVGILLFIGFRVARKQVSAEHYFVGGGKLPGWAVGMSMFSTLLSSFVFVAFPGQTFDRNWEVLMQQFTTPVIIVLAALIIIPLYRRVIRISAYEYLEERFGYAARLYGTTGFLLGHFFKIGVVLSAMSLAMHSITQWNQDVIIIGLGAVTLVYTYFGGIEGVVWTDVVQGTLMILAGFVTIGFILVVASPGNGSAIVEAAQAQDKFRLIDPTFNLTDKTVWVIAWMGFFHFMSRYFTDQTMVQRYLLAPSTGQAVKGAFIGIACCMVAWTTFALIGTLLYGFYEIHPERLAETVTKGDMVFPYFIGSELPAGLTGIVLTGLLAATMSTLSSDLNSFGACVVSDFYDRYRRGVSQERRLRVSRVAVLVAGFAAIGLAAAIARYADGIMEFVLNAWALMGAVLSGGILAAFFLGIFCPRVNARGLYIGLGFGLCFVLWCLATKNGFIDLPEAISFLVYGYHEWWLMGISNILVCIIGYGASFFLRRSGPVSAHLTVYKNAQ